MAKKKPKTIGECQDLIDDWWTNVNQWEWPKEFGEIPKPHYSGDPKKTACAIAFTVLTRVSKLIDKR